MISISIGRGLLVSVAVLNGLVPIGRISVL